MAVRVADTKNELNNVELRSKKNCYKADAGAGVPCCKGRKNGNNETMLLHGIVRQSDHELDEWKMKKSKLFDHTVG